MKIFAHRGSSLIWPENTMLAFDMAHAAGCTGFETDLRLSKDKEIILSHDDNLSRFGLPQKWVSQLNLKEIRDLEIVSRDNKYKDNLIPLKTLLEKYRHKDYIFDCKSSEKLLFLKLEKIISETKPQDDIYFLTWSKKGEQHVKNIFPGKHVFARVNWTTIWGWASIIGLGRLFEPKNRALALPAYHLGLPVFSRRQVSSVKKRGKLFLGYLVNNEKDYQVCVDATVDGVLTDRCDLISGLMQKGGAKN